MINGIHFQFQNETQKRFNIDEFSNLNIIKIPLAEIKKKVTSLASKALILPLERIMSATDLFSDLL